MKKRIYKLSEEQYKRLTEDEVFSTTSADNKPKTVVKTTKSGLSNATAKALDTNASSIEITDAVNVNESVITKNQLVTEARKDWKNGTKVVKMSELLKN